jgi:peptidyl-tRNA hydrolase
MDLEAKEMDKRIEQRDNQREHILASLSEEERARIEELKDKADKAFRLMLQNKDASAYEKARTEYRKAVEKWPILND